MTEEDIPGDADCWLFAEDLINFVFRDNTGFPISPISEECRGFVHEGFTETVRSAVQIIERKLTHEIEAVFAEMSSKANITEAYSSFTSDLRKVCGSSIFDGNKFIYYCVIASYLGEKFYRTGLEDFHYLTFETVREALKSYDMSNESWSTLELVADAITSVEKDSETLPSPNEEQDTLDANMIQEQINRTWNILHENTDCLNEDTASGREESSDFGGSAQSLESDGGSDICDESENDSVSESSSDSFSSYSVSLKRKPTQSNTVSSSTEILKFPKELENYLKAYTKKNTDETDIKYALSNTVDENAVRPLYLSKHCGKNAFCSKTQLNASVSKPLSHSLRPTLETNKNCKTVSKKVCIQSEQSSEIENTEKESRVCLDLSQRHYKEQLFQQMSEPNRFETNSELSIETETQNSSECTSTDPKPSEDSKSFSE